MSRPFINLPDRPGIIALLESRPVLGEALSILAQVLLRGPSSILEGEREMIAAYTSYQNDCAFCHETHLRAAANLLGLPLDEARHVITGQISHSQKMTDMFEVADGVVHLDRGGIEVTIAGFRESSTLTDAEIHDVVAITSAFCMYNRYVDGLGTVFPDSDVLDELGRQLSDKGYTAKRLPVEGVPNPRDSEATVALPSAQ